MYDLKIDFGKVILVGKKSRLSVLYGSEFETKWALVKGIENKVFCLKSNEINTQKDLPQEIQDTYEIIDLEKRLRAKIKNIIDKELDNLMKENKEYVLDYEIRKQRNYKTGEIELEKEYQMLEDSYLFGKNIRDDDYRTRYMKLDISEIDKGIIYPLENKKIIYDIAQDKFICSDRETLLALYNEREVKQIISYEQYKLGLTPPIYNEIAKINEFMKDKNSITVELKNGTIFKTDATLRNILNVYSNGEIYVSRTYSQKILEGNTFSDFQYKADEIKSIKFNRKEIKIQGRNLTSIDKQSKEKILESEETEEM